MAFGQEAAGGPRNSDALFAAQKERVGGEYGFPRTPAQKWVQKHKYSDSRVADMREELPVETVHLERRFPKEFEAAEKHMSERKASWSESFRHNVMYDYDKDRTFKFWQDEQQERKEVLHMHDLDIWLDNFWDQVRYGLRIFTTAGLLHGGYKTYRLWSTIDKNYAKLHGVGFSSIALEQVSYSVLKGAGMGVAFAAGNLAGDNTARLASMWRENSIHRPRRQWYNITAAFVVGGMCASLSSVGVNWFSLKPMGHAAVIATIMSASTTAGVHFGVNVYKPWVALYPDDYEASPRPWHEQEFQRLGPVGMRGRWA